MSEASVILTWGLKIDFNESLFFFFFKLARYRWVTLSKYLTLKLGRERGI